VPRIIKTEQVADALSNAGPFVVRAVIYDDVTSDRGFFDRGVVLNYSVAGALGPVQVPMKWMGNSIWRGTIPSQPTGSIIDYFVTATDYAGNVGTGPTMQFGINFPPCPGDITGDHIVGVPDLLAVINAWGQAVVTHNVDLDGQDFVPDITNAKSGDTVNWIWVSGGTHSITSGTPCTSDGTFNQIISAGTFQYVIPTSFDGAIPYFCIPHCAFGMTATINVAPFKEDVDQSGSVGVPDLLGVINGWGNCPINPFK
jgi:plastocyanin